MNAASAVVKVNVQLVDGSKFHNGAKYLELDNNGAADSEVASHFMIPMVSKAEDRVQFLNDLNSGGLNDKNFDNLFDISSLTVRAEKTPRWRSSTKLRNL